MTKKAIPKVPIINPQQVRFDTAMKENLEVLLGMRGGKIEKLKQGASLDEVVAKVNEILSLLYD